MRDQDRTRLNALLDEMNADNEGGPRLIGALSDIYNYVLPELATSTGREGLKAWTLYIARHDDGDG